MLVSSPMETGRHWRADVEHAYDHVARDYDGWYTSARDHAEDAWIARQLRAVTAGRRTLDLGCGPGNATQHTDPSMEYLGVDVSTKMLDIARAKHPHRRFVQGTMETASNFGQYGAVVSVFSAFSYVRVPGQCATELRHATDLRGRLFLMAYGLETSRRDAYRYSAADAQPVSRRCYAAHELKSIFRVAGWRDLQVQGLTSGACADKLQGVTRPWVARVGVELDALTVGRTDPDQCLFLVLTGRR